MKQLEAPEQVTPPGRRSPHGGRGLKPFGVLISIACPPSLPSRGAWIETPELHAHAAVVGVAPLTGGVD